MESVLLYPANLGLKVLLHIPSVRSPLGPNAALSSRCSCYVCLPRKHLAYIPFAVSAVIGLSAPHQGAILEN
jgi:hypothetical protein